MHKRKTIAIDIDNVIAASAEGFAEFSNKKWNSGITAEQYSEEWAPLWGVPVEEAIRRAAEFNSSEVHGTYRPLEAAQPVLRNLSRRYNLVRVTSRPAASSKVTNKWLATHFEGLLSEVHYVGIWDKDHDAATVGRRLQQTKAALCLEIGADYLIDDQLKHCLAAASADINALPFGDSTWNREPVGLPPNVIRVSDWGAIKEYFDGQS